MKEGWSTRWKSLLIWVCGYLSIIAFAVAGGYAIVKSNDDELKATAKKAFIVTLIFTLISMFLGLYSAIGGMTDGYYSSAAYKAYGIMSAIATIAKIVVFVIFAALSFFGGNSAPALQSKAEQQTEDRTDDELKF